MQARKYFSSLLFYVSCIVSFSTSLLYGKVSFIDPNSEITCSMYGMLRPEMFAGVHDNLINKDNKDDRSIWWRHTLDWAINIYDKNLIVELDFSLRNKGVWGNSGSIARTNPQQVKLKDTILGTHVHTFPRHILWMRECWLRIDIGQLFGCMFENTHYFTIGSFPFQLGRGIALGDAFAVGQEVLGFYSDSAVDQYAFGTLFSGTLVKDTIDYALYAAILENKSDRFSNTSAKVRAQQYGRRFSPSRGFGIMNYLFAGYLDWYALNDDVMGTLKIQPYWLFNHDKEQSVEFVADASSVLGTIGMELDYVGNIVEFGIEGAYNFGHQCVRGWDRNQVIFDCNDALVAQVNSHVVDSDGNKIPFVSKSESQDAIFKADQSECQNGKQIPCDDCNTIGYLMPKDGTIFNAKDRFRDPYTNTFQGWMIVSDVSVWLYNKDLKISSTLGAASGDDNPNFDTINRNYKGFIGLQEVYSGKRVKSAFFLGSAGKVGRPISNPTNLERSNTLSKTVNGFTNFIFSGMGLTWAPTNWSRPFKINPNFFAFWEFRSIPKFVIDTPTNCISDIPRADTHLGIELNLFMDCNIAKNLKIFSVTSLFVPGQFYRDIKGRRIAQDAALLLDRKDSTGFTKDSIPAFGDDMAMTFSFGIDYRF